MKKEKKSNRVSVAIGAMKPMHGGHYGMIAMAIKDELRPMGTNGLPVLPAEETYIIISANDRVRKGEMPIRGDVAIDVLNRIYFESEKFLHFAEAKLAGTKKVNFIITVTEKFYKNNPERAEKIESMSVDMNNLIKQKNLHPESSVKFLKHQRGAMNVFSDIMSDPKNQGKIFSLYCGNDDLKQYGYIVKNFPNVFEIAGRTLESGEREQGMPRLEGGASGTEARDLMNRFGSLSEKEKERLIQMFPEFAQGRAEEIVNLFRSGARESGYEGLSEIRRYKRDEKGYGNYLEEIMNELQYIKKEYGSRTKAGSRYRLEANKLQGAYSELRKLKRKHEKQFPEEAMLSERAVRRATGYDDYSGKDEEFNRDSVRDFFDKFK